MAWKKFKFLINSQISYKIFLIKKENDIQRIRPGYGIKPKFFSDIIGKKILKGTQRGDPVKWEVLEN